MRARGFLLGDGRGHRRAPEGTYFPQPRVGASGGREVLLDELLGPGFAVLVRQGTQEASARAAQALADALGARCLSVIAQDKRPARDGEVMDREGVLGAWFERYGVDIAVLRPDRYLFGAVRGSHLSWLAGALRERIRGPLRGHEPSAGAPPRAAPAV